MHALNSPSMGQNGGKLVQTPSKRIYGKSCLQSCQLALLPHEHHSYVQREQNGKLDLFQDISISRHNQTVLVQQRRFSRIIERNGLQLVVVWNNVPESGWCVDDATFVDGRHDVVTGAGTEKVLALGQDGDLERRQGTVNGPGRLGLGLLSNIAGGVLKWVEPGHEDVSQQQQAVCALVVLAEAAQDASGDELAERGACPIDVVSCARVGFLQEELSSVDEQTVDYGFQSGSLALLALLAFLVCL